MVRHNLTAWTWQDVQSDFANCTDGLTPRPNERYAVWQSTAALGNALNVWVHIFLFAVASGRQLLVGQGVVPELLCGPRGAYLCGVEAPGKQWFHGKKMTTAKWDDLFDESELALVPVQWFSYKDVGAAMFRGSKSSHDKRTCLECMQRSLRCQNNARNGLDVDSCVMVRAMQMLLPGARLRDDFLKAALVTASESWMGSLKDLDTVLKHHPHHHTGVFFDPPTHRLDAAARFSGAIHIRALPPKLEKEGSHAHLREYAAFLNEMNTTSFWLCVAKHARAADAPYRRDGWPSTVFVATDVQGLCRVARRHVNLACMDVAPAHLTKANIEGPLVRGGLDSHQLAVLDWHLLARSRWLVSVGRAGDHCAKGSSRDGTHGVGGPGRSFYGWALANSNLVHPPASYQIQACPCHVNTHSVSVWYPPAATAGLSKDTSSAQQQQDSRRRRLGSLALLRQIQLRHHRRHP